MMSASASRVLSPSRPPRLVSARLRRVVGATVLTFGLLGTFVTSAIAEPSARYEVRPGDTLYGIAADYGVSPSWLADLNDLSNPNLIKSGEVLQVGRTAATTATPTAAPSTPVPVASSAADGTVISAPYVNQFDGSVWGPSNCGPTALAIALGGIDVHAKPLDLRALANTQMRNWNASNGTTWEALAYAAHRSGALTAGLYQGRYYRSWSVADLKGELAAGHPVLLLVRYRSLPDHQTSHYWGDHYIVALGFDTAGNLVYDDPAAPNGANRRLTPNQLSTAWGRTSVGLVRTAMAVEK